MMKQNPCKWLVSFGTALCFAIESDAAPQLSFGTASAIVNVNSSTTDVEPHIAADGLALYFCSSAYPGNEFDVNEVYLYVSERATIADAWGPPTPLPPLINQGNACGPSLSADGKSLYFNRGDSSDGLSGEIYEVTRPSTELPWGEPVLLGDVFNEGASNLSPFITNDGLEMYFTSTRSGSLGQWDLWVSRRLSVEDEWGAAFHLDAPINSSAGDLGAELSPDGRWLFFASDRSGSWQLWGSHRRTRTADWDPPVRLPSTVNRAASVWPNMSTDGSTLYYAVTSQGPTGLDLWQASVDQLPPLGDYDDDGVLSNVDIDEVSGQIRLAQGDLRYDVNEDWKLDADDRAFWVHHLANTYFGDANLDGEFNSGDLVQVFTTGKYETQQQAGWAEGDWNGDGEFSSVDFVVAFQDRGYEQGPRQIVSAVPEPSGFGMISIGLALATVSTRRTGRRLQCQREPKRFE